MSRIIVFDLENRSVGEFEAACNRGYMLYGNTGVDGAGYTTVPIPDDVAAQPWLQLGRMVLIERPPLPPWAGVIDAPWSAVSPVEMTLYNAEYLFSLRTPDAPVRLTGTVAGIVQGMISLCNEQENMYLATGKASGDKGDYDEVLDQRNMWEQLVPILERNAHEMVLRPERENGQLTLYADVGVALGDDTGYLLDDGGPGKNMRVTAAQVDGDLFNRVIGVSGESTSDAQLQTDVLQDKTSQSTYRLRSRVLSYRNITQLSTLTEYTRNALAVSKSPYIDLTVETMNVNDAFSMLRPGNRLIVHAHQLYLPGGVIGWRGPVRVLAMVYDEEKDVLQIRLRGNYA